MKKKSFDVKVDVEKRKKLTRKNIISHIGLTDQDKEHLICQANMRDFF